MKYENEQTEPSIESLKNLSAFYGVSIDYLVGVSEERSSNSSDSFSQEEIKLIMDYRSLNQQGKEYVLQTMAMSVKIYQQLGSVSVMEDQA